MLSMMMNCSLKSAKSKLTLKPCSTDITSNLTETSSPILEISSVTTTRPNMQSASQN